jgi:hypothetical protein
MTMLHVSPQRLLLTGWLLTNLQVNITTLHDTGHTRIYITLVLLFMFFFTLLPFFWAGWLSSIPFVRYTYFIGLKLRINIGQNLSSLQNLFQMDGMGHLLVPSIGWTLPETSSRGHRRGYLPSNWLKFIKTTCCLRFCQ